MPQFSYTAINSSGKEIRGKLAAEKESDVDSSLRANGYFPTEIKIISDKKKKESDEKLLKSTSKKKTGLLNLQIGGTKMSSKELVLFTRQLSILLDAGLPLIKALRTLERQAKNKITQKVIGETADYVEGGFTFSESLGKNKKSFDSLYVNMIQAGETSGALEIILSRLAGFMEKLSKIISKIKSAMIYPSVVLIVAVLVTMFLMIVIVPKFSTVFTELLNGMPLPGLTVFVMNVSGFMMNNYLKIFIAIVILIILYKVLRRTKKGKYILDIVKFKMPIFGSITSKTSIAKFSRTLGTLLSSGVPVLKALIIVKDTAGNGLVENAIQKVHDGVKEGESIASPLAATKIFPAMVVSMIEVGEDTGKLPELLERVADTYEEEVDLAVSAMTSLIEPIMIVFMAVIVGTIVIAMFLPLIKIMQTLGGG